MQKTITEELEQMTLEDTLAELQNAPENAFWEERRKAQAEEKAREERLKRFEK